MTAPPARRRSPLRGWLAALALALCLPLQGHSDDGDGLRLDAARLPSLGDESAMGFSAERELGDSIAREIYRDPDWLDDLMLGDYVGGIWRQLIQQARARGELSADMQERFAWEVMIIRDRSVNAFALPGAYMGVHLGLIGVVGDSNELASVLAHELSHVTQRHISRIMTRQQRQAPWLMGAMILGMLAASRSPDAAGAVMTGGQALALQTQLNFSRDMEREADRVGLGVMAAAGYAPQGFVSMFEKLQQASRMNDNGAFPYLRSHPLTTERMADMHARQQFMGARPAARAPSLLHTLMAARARVLANTGTDALRTWLVQPTLSGFAAQPLARQAAALYGAVMASLQQRDWATAEHTLSRLQNLTQGDAPAQRALQWMAVEAALAQTQYERARHAMPADAPDASRVELLLWVQVMLHGHASRADEAAPQAQALARLQPWLALHPRDAAAWQLLAALNQTLGHPVRALRAEAEARAAQFDYAGALDRLRAAQDEVRRGSDDFMEASIVDTRARALQSLLLEQTLQR